MDYLGEPTNHHLPRSQLEEYDSSIPQPCGRIFDEMVMLQKIRGDQKTFAELGDSMMSMVLHEGTDSQRIDVVFNVYRNNSIKNHKREKRGSESGHKVRNYKADYKIHQWRTSSCPIPRINRS